MRADQPVGRLPPIVGLLLVSRLARLVRPDQAEGRPPVSAARRVGWGSRVDEVGLQ